MRISCEGFYMSVNSNRLVAGHKPTFNSPSLGVIWNYLPVRTNNSKTSYLIQRQKCPPYYLKLRFSYLPQRLPRCRATCRERVGCVCHDVYLCRAFERPAAGKKVIEKALGLHGCLSEPVESFELLRTSLADDVRQRIAIRHLHTNQNNQVLWVKYCHNQQYFVTASTTVL